MDSPLQLDPVRRMHQTVQNTVGIVGSPICACCTATGNWLVNSVDLGQVAFVADLKEGSAFALRHGGTSPNRQRSDIHLPQPASRLA